MVQATNKDLRAARWNAGPVLAKRRRRAGMGAALGGIVLALGVAAPVLGATFTVNSTADATDGSCGPAVGECTLREAIEAAVATPGRDTIGFDGGVFVPGPTPVRITLASALPVVADPAGTVVTGAGASVRIDGDFAVENGLVFASAEGVPLGKVTVANLTVQGFTNNGVHICGGAPPTCDADLTGALVRNVVAVSSGASGIQIEGRVNKKPRVIDSVTFQSGDGIRLQGNPTMIGARVQGSTASRSGGRGIWLLADQQTGSVVVDSFGLKSDDDGIALTDDGATIKPKITNVVAYANDNGIAMFNDQLVAPTISNAIATKNAARGIVIAANAATAAALTRVVADSNVSHGIVLDGIGSGAKITGARAVGNEESGIHTDAETNLTMTNVIAAANYGGISLSAATSIVTRTNSSANYYSSGVSITNAGGNTVTNSSTLANGTYAYGVFIAEGSSGNTIGTNVSLGNGIDLVDDNDDCGGNAWSNNVFFSGSQPCIH